MGLQQFTIPGGAGRPALHCVFHSIVTGISVRHSDTVDVQFLVNGKPVIVALAHAGIARFRQTASKPLNDSGVIEMAGLFLKGFLEMGEQIPGPILPVSLEQTLALARQAPSISQPA